MFFNNFVGKKGIVFWMHCVAILNHFILHSVCAKTNNQVLNTLFIRFLITVQSGFPQSNDWNPSVTNIQSKNKLKRAT